MPDVSQKPVTGVRRVPRAERDEMKDLAHRPASGCHVNAHDALEKALLRVLHDIREQKHELAAGRTPAPRKTREAVPGIVNGIFLCFPYEYAE
jgi:hypothetical protein